MTPEIEPPRRRVPTAHRWHSEWLSVQPLTDAIYRLSRQLRGERFLDVGCGNKPYRDWVPDAVFYVGVDIARANSMADVIAHADHLPFAAETFDTVLCSQVMEHVARPTLLLAELWRVLKLDGQLLLSVPMYWCHHEEPYDFYRYTRHGLRYLLESAGFDIQILEQQGGAWRVVGQSLANAFSVSIRFRTFGLKALTLILINSVFWSLDLINYQPTDTCGFIVLARRGQNCMSATRESSLSSPAGGG